jgi:death on curing protein
VTYYLTTDDALEVASLVTGAPARVRDFTELTAALARPQQVSDGQDLYPGIWDKAAALMDALGRCYALVGREQAAHLECDLVLPGRERRPAGRPAG